MLDFEKEFQLLKNPGTNLATASVHKSGKIGFSSQANNLMKLDGNKYIRIGKKLDDKIDEILYMSVDSKDTEGSFKVVKAGRYYYINTASLLEELDIKYKKGETITYRVKKFNDSENIFQLTKKETKKKDSELGI